MTTLTAQEIMTHKVLTVELDWSLEELRVFLVNHSVSGALVISHDGRPVGVVSATDLLRAGPTMDPPEQAAAFYTTAVEHQLGVDEIESLNIEQGSSLRVRDIMTPVVFDVPSDAPVHQVAEIMVRGRIHRVLVTRDHRVVGIISALDLVRVLHDLTAPVGNVSA